MVGSTANERALAERFEEHRRHLFLVAHQILGSTTDAQDAVQEAWIRLARSEEPTRNAIDNLGAWLTTVVSRVALNVLRARATRREEPLEDRAEFLPEPVVALTSASVDPITKALHFDALSDALSVVLDQLSPSERLAFVLHDLFVVPFDDIAKIIDRSPEATRQLASRARRRVNGQAPLPMPDLARQRTVVEAFFAAAHDGDLARLIAVLDPEVTLHADFGARTATFNGAAKVAGNALMFASTDRVVHPAIVNGTPGVAITLGSALLSVMEFTFDADRITEIAVYADPALTSRLATTLGLA